MRIIMADVHLRPVYPVLSGPGEPLSVQPIRNCPANRAATPANETEPASEKQIAMQGIHSPAAIQRNRIAASSQRGRVDRGRPNSRKHRRKGFEHEAESPS